MAAFGVNMRSIHRWMADFINGEQKALLAKPIPGRPPKVRAEEMRWLAQAVRDHAPLQYKDHVGLSLGIDHPDQRTPDDQSNEYREAGTIINEVAPSMTARRPIRLGRLVHPR